MKTAFHKNFMALLLLSLPLLSAGQGRVYTKSARMADFPTKTTKVVLTGQTVLDALLKEEFTSRWRISPYEFCDIDEYNRQKSAGLYYFIHFASDAEFTYMLLTKGGPESGTDPLKTALEVVSLPISAAGTPSSDELIFLPAFIDIVQEYVQKALVSEKTAYLGLKGIRRGSTRGKTLCRDEAEGRKLFLEAAPDTVVPVMIWPSGDGPAKHYYRMLISTDTHVLYGFKRGRM